MTAGVIEARKVVTGFPKPETVPACVTELPSRYYATGVPGPALRLPEFAKPVLREPELKNPMFLLHDGECSDVDTAGVERTQVAKA